VRLGSVVSAFLPKPSHMLDELLPDIEEQPVIATASNSMLNLVSFVLIRIFITSINMRHDMFKSK
jgi:hypothetical protein